MPSREATIKLRLTSKQPLKPVRRLPHMSLPTSDFSLSFPIADQQAYNGNAQNLDANGLGMAAALQALKQFQGGNSGGGGGSQSQLVGAAMAQAAKLFESSGTLSF